LGQRYDELRAAGLNVAAIGLGEPKHARRYCGQLAPHITCLCNKTAEAYEAYGIREGTLAQLVNAGLWKGVMRATKAGFIQGRATGNSRLLGGTFVVDQSGVIRHVHYNRFAGDHPDLSEIAAAFAHLKHEARRAAN
jgi:peroxiredoxin